MRILNAVQPQPLMPVPSLQSSSFATVLQLLHIIMLERYQEIYTIELSPFKRDSSSRLHKPSKNTQRWISQISTIATFDKIPTFGINTHCMHPTCIQLIASWNKVFIWKQINMLLGENDRRNSGDML